MTFTLLIALAIYLFSCIQHYSGWRTNPKAKSNTANSQQKKHVAINEYWHKIFSSFFFFCFIRQLLICNHGMRPQFNEGTTNHKLYHHLLWPIRNVCQAESAGFRHLEQDCFIRPANLRRRSHDITDKWAGQTGAVVASHTVTVSPRAFTIVQGLHFFFPDFY